MNLTMSPFVVPLGAFCVAIVAIIAAQFGAAHRARAKAEQRMAMVARGMSIEDIERLLGAPGAPEISPKDPLRSLGNARRAGLVLVSFGVGLVLLGLALAVILSERDVLACSAAGLIPLAIGVGFLVDYQMQKRELSRFGLEVDAELPQNSRLG
jgi:uncharacterized membrane protein